MITREEAFNLMNKEFLYSEMEYKFPLLNAFGRKKNVIGSPINILSWDQVIDYVNGGIKKRGEEYYFRIGPNSLIDKDFEIWMMMALSPNNSENNRLLLRIEIINYATEWVQSRNYFWQCDTDIAVAYYGLQMLIYQLSEDALEKGKKKIKMTPKLFKQIFDVLKVAELER